MMRSQPTERSLKLRLFDLCLRVSSIKRSCYKKFKDQMMLDTEVDGGRKEVGRGSVSTHNSMTEHRH